MALMVEARDGVLEIVLNRPQVHNAIDPETQAELVETWVRFRDDDSLRVAVITGAGDRAFCAGIDLDRMGDFYGRVPAERRREVWDREPGIGGITRNLDPGKPVIAAVNGYCLGAGLELALACDLRYASERATFGLPEVRWAILPGQGGTQRLPRAIPPNVALEMILTGRPIPAQRAFEVGLVNALVPADRLRSETRAIAEAIAGLPARAVRHAREAVRRGLELPLSEGLKLEQALADPLRDAPENRSARSGFGAKGTAARPTDNPSGTSSHK